MRILVSGTSGFIGSHLVKSFEGKHEVFRLVRKNAANDREVSWDIAKGYLDVERLKEIAPEVVIHLAGENIMGVWTEAKKKEMMESRSKSTALLCESLLQLSTLPRMIISASAVGYYGNRGDTELDEQSEKGTGFLSDLVDRWEHSWDNIKSRGVPVFMLRFGLVLSPAGGFLGKLYYPFYLGLGGVVGSGAQWVSWISLRDTLRIFHFILGIEGQRLVPGPINVVAPYPVTNYGLTKTLGRVLWRPTLFWVPEFALRLVLGREMAEETALVSQRVLPRALLAAGFTFLDSLLGQALETELYSKYDVTSLQTV